MTDDSPLHHQPLSRLDRARIALAGMRYDFWLDLRYTPRRRRRELRTELTANLTEAAERVGVAQALAGVGSLRVMAAETTRPDEAAPRWYAGTVAGLTAFTGALFLLLVQTFSYLEGVLDSEVVGEVSSSLFPFVWTEITVISGEDGFEFFIAPGPVPLVFAVVVAALVARPWRALRSRAADPATALH
ncbi:MAG: hypothetical protein AAF962_09955 [Actinomycetota bacterium]